MGGDYPMRKHLAKILIGLVMLVYVLQFGFYVFASTLSQSYKKEEKQQLNEYKQQVLQNNKKIQSNLLNQYQQRVSQLKQNYNAQQLSADLKKPEGYGNQIANTVDTKLLENNYDKIKSQMLNQYANSKTTIDKNTLSQYLKDTTNAKSQYSASSQKITGNQNTKTNINSNLQSKYNSLNTNGISFNNTKYEQIKNQNNISLKSPVDGFNSNLSVSNNNIKNAHENAYTNKTLPQMSTTKNFAGLDKKYNNFKQVTVPNINKKNYNNINKQTSVQNYVAGSSKLNKMVSTAQRKTKNAQKTKTTKK